MLIIALTWPPSRNVIANGPLRPVVEVVGNVWSTVSRPLTFAYQQQQITDRNVQVRQLNDKLEADRKAADAKDAQIAALQKQLTAAQSAPAADASPAPGASGAPGAAAAGSGAGTGAATSASDTDTLRRIAQQWSSMDPERAAALAQKLPPDYDASVFAQMSPDNVGPIMDALPATFAAKIVQSGPQAQISARTSR
jgi:hypothetical protein